MTPATTHPAMKDGDSDALPAGDDRSAGPTWSFVVPVYGSPESLELLSQRIKDVCSRTNVSYELILVDDRCPKGSWYEIERLVATDSAIIGIRLSRNFGQHAAIQAGLSRATGEWTIVMDCDLQDQPEEVPRLWAKAKEGFEVVRAERVTRNDPIHRRLLSKIFYGLLSYLTDTRQRPEFANFGIYSRRVIETITRWQEESKYFPAIVSWVGFSQTTLAVEQAPRFEGRSSYTFGKLVALGMNVIVGFSDKPLKLVMVTGFLIALLSFSMTFFVLVSHLMGALTVEGWASIALSLWFLAGSLLFAVGLTGLYVGRILVEAKGRPTFIVDRILTGSGTELRPESQARILQADDHTC
ncbi:MULTISPECIES: glycosyltransferase family 2 protein [unclassified Bradyrhizobium]|uniref:glycosyltransferase family 2 protein n=1 Tax=unclassified Bradyrhizobium TaxID=2631580 RepID=UPI00247B1031|nr:MULTISPECIES: glycosyltransferase family 2 protein [unclassified Bradyrhizobium]WGS22835.1 glycosyltransferase family 2 protein [Bradyrhizobium sp. ISRA463]WGS29826.1 glycosyltransferase family 2 protein [Bradyrhizobium sp. ISRA464]